MGDGVGIPLVVDLESDTGAGFWPRRLGGDGALLDVVASVNVACGCHAGDLGTMPAVRVCHRAVHRRTAIGAHVGYRGLAGTAGAPGRGSGAR